MVTPEHHVALVDHLVQHSQPVRRIWPIRVRLGMFIACGSAAAVLVAWRWSRPDLTAKLHEPVFTIGLAALALATGFTALLALRSAVPGRTPSRLEAGLALVLVGAAALLLCHSAVDDPTTDPSFATGWLCAVRTLAIAAVPWSVLLIALRRGAPVRVSGAAIYAGTAALLFATTVLRTTCPDDESLHWLMWHLAVVGLASALSIAPATRWLQTWGAR